MQVRGGEDPHIFIRHSPQKSPITKGSFAKNDLHLKASCGSSPPGRYVTFNVATPSTWL